jgi:pseudaminic acid cytidylyltransferase
MKKSLAIITARGGSKRIPRKNIKPFLGKPIINYSIEAAIQSGCFDEVMVSTDDDEIAAIAVLAGAAVPFKRSKQNADDHSTTADVITEVLNQYINNRQNFDIACCIYPTAPFVTPAKLKLAHQKLIATNAKAVVPVVRFGFPILRSIKMENELVSMNWPEYLNTRSQDLPPAFHDAGQFYFFQVDNFLNEKKVFTDNTIGIEMPESEVQDIDNKEDWEIAEMKYTMLLKNKKEIHELL